MKKMVLGIVGMIVLSAQVLMAAVTVEVLPSFGPNSSVSSYFDWAANAKGWVSGDGRGDTNTPGYYANSFSGNLNQMIVTKTVTNFNYWAGTINPTGNFTNEYGGALYLGSRIEGNGNKVSLSKLSYDFNPSVYLTESSGNFSASTYNNLRIGLIDIGSGNYSYITSGSATQECDAVFVIRAGIYSFATDGSGTAQWQLDEILNTHSNFSFNATFTYDAGGLNEVTSGPVTVSVIPEPAIMGMVAIGGFLIWIKRRFYARI